MKKCALVLLTLFLFNHLDAQDHLTVRGRVLQKSDSLPVLNAHIYFEGEGIGTATNEEGGFIFHFSDKHRGKKIYISCIGCDPYTLSPNQISTQPIVVYLEESKYLLDEVKVVAIDPASILESTIDNLQENYNQKKFTKTLYYKEYFERGGKPLRYLEVVADLTAGGFNNNRKNPDSYDVSIKEKRTGYNNDTTYTEGGNGIGVLHWLAWSEQYLKKRKLKEHQIEYMGRLQYHNNEIYHILLKKHGKHYTIETSLYITTDTYAIVAIHYSFINSNREKLKSNQTFRFLEFRQYVDFQQKKDSYWYVNSIDDYRNSINQQGVIFEIKRSIRVTSVNPNIKLNTKNKITRDTDLYHYDVPYRPPFWKYYNIPPATAEENRIREEIGVVE